MRIKLKTMDKTFLMRRIFTLEGGTDVLATIFQPKLYPKSDFDDYMCEYEIVGLSRKIQSAGHGVDAVQAVLHAMVGLGTRLYCSDEYKSGKLTWFDSYDLMLPFPFGARDIDEVFFKKN
ncbi:MAG: hypothetical protein FD163_1204 [Hyphomonadaceae bacterium]|nr:MAG: hypothetical protein FD163_1204 [Hyphomonadaceae bacterium]